MGDDDEVTAETLNTRVPVRTDDARSSGVQSVDRAFDLLERLADAGGATSLTQLAADTELPLPTIHRLVRTLVAGGYVRQEPSRRYALGPRLIRLGDSASKLLGTWAKPRLSTLVDEIGETANLALLDGDEVIYVAQVPSRHSVRMFTEPGRRFSPHCTGVGKALLAQLPDDTVRALLARTGMPRKTDSTITEPAAMLRELAHIRGRGYALDEGEQEIGVRCIAVPIPGGVPLAAISISGPAGRVTDDLVARAVPLMRATAAEFIDDMADA